MREAGRRAGYLSLPPIGLAAPDLLQHGNQGDVAPHQAPLHIGVLRLLPHGFVVLDAIPMRIAETNTRRFKNENDEFLLKRGGEVFLYYQPLVEGIHELGRDGKMKRGNGLTAP